MAFSRLSLITGIALALSSCVQPVNLQEFVNSLPKPVEVHIEYTQSDESPKLYSTTDEVSWKLLKEGSASDPSFTLYFTGFGSPNTAIIEVVDEHHFDSIAWYCESTTTPLTAAQGVTGTNKERLKITAGSAPFAGPKTYQLIVTGKIGEKTYGTSVHIRVIQ